MILAIDLRELECRFDHKLRRVYVKSGVLEFGASAHIAMTVRSVG
jgi:hypothetical protein